MLGRKREPLEPGSWPDRARRPRVLVEHRDAAIRSAYARVLDRAGYDVETCGGPGDDGEPVQCPLLEDRPCPLVDGADVVLSSCDLVRSRDILSRLASTARAPVVFEAPKPMFDSYRDVAGESLFLAVPVTETTLRAAVAAAQADRV